LKVTPAQTKTAAPEGAAAFEPVVGCVNGPSVDWPLSAQPSGTVWFQETTSFPHEDSQPSRPL